MEDDNAQPELELDTWYDGAGAPTEVTQRDLEKFLDKAAEFWQVPALRGSTYAKAILCKQKT